MREKKGVNLKNKEGGQFARKEGGNLSVLSNIYRSEGDESSSMAFAILTELGLTNVEPEPEIPVQYRSLKLEDNKGNDNFSLLGVWPNPASQKTFIHYPFEVNGNCILTVTDPQGRLIDSFVPNGNGLHDLNVASYQSGIYIIQLVAFDKVVDSIKLTVLN